jgi:predicted SnoaL-like aldol condensation-catalyzing enzyme
MADNAELVRTALTELFVDGDESAIDKYWDADYVQHNPLMPDGTAGFRAGLAAAGGKIEYRMGTLVADGDHVMVHGRYVGWGPTPMIGVDIFRVEDGKIVEHWDVLQPEVPADKTVSGHPMFPAP